MPSRFHAVAVSGLSGFGPVGLIVAARVSVAARSRDGGASGLGSRVAACRCVAALSGRDFRGGWLCTRYPQDWG